MTKVLWATLEALGRQDEWEKFGKGRCEHVSTLAVLLGECLGSTDGKFVLVLDGIDKQREAPQTLLSAVARLGEVVSCYAVLLGWMLTRVDSIVDGRFDTQFYTSTTFSAGCGCSAY